MNNEFQQNPFVCGRSISDPHRYIGRQTQVREFYSYLGNMDSCSVVGERRIGKTSFLRYISHPRVQCQFGYHPEENLFLFIDLSDSSNCQSPEQFWADLESKLIQEVGNHKIIKETGVRELGELLDDLKLLRRRIVLLLDEFESVTRNPNFDLNFYANLRSLTINHHNLALVTSSRRELVELCHSKEIASSPFFNIFSIIDLALFTHEEVDELIKRYLTDTDICFTPSEHKTLQHVSGCHPFFLQMACHSLFEAYVDNKSTSERLADMLTKMRRDSTSHFGDGWKYLSDDQQITLTAFAILSTVKYQEGINIEELTKIASRSERLLHGLVRRGLLVVRSGKYALFSPLYREWIIHEVFDPSRSQKDESFDRWFEKLIVQPAIDVAVKSEKTSIIQALIKVRREKRTFIQNWLTSESAGNVSRILLFLAELFQIINTLNH